MSVDPAAPVYDLDYLRRDESAESHRSEGGSVSEQTNSSAAAYVDCPTCHGASSVDPDPACPTCHGEGEVTDHDALLARIKTYTEAAA